MRSVSCVADNRVNGRLERRAVGVYPELDNLNLKELIDCWHKLPLDGEEYAALYYSEVASLIRSQGEAGIAFLFEEISRADTEKLGAILFFLPPLDHPAIRDILLRYLHDERPSIVANAVDGLQRQGEKDIIDEVLTLRTHPSPYVRGSVLRFISHLYPESAPSLLIEALQDSDYIVRENAIDELDSLGVVEAIPYIHPLLADSHPDTRQAAKTAVENLERLTDKARDSV